MYVCRRMCAGFVVRREAAVVTVDRVLWAPARLCARWQSPVSTKHIFRAQLDPSAERAEAEPNDVATVVSAETTDALEIGLLARIERVVPLPLRC